MAAAGGSEPFVGVVAKRGRFRVVEPLFEPGAQVPLSGGAGEVGAMVLVRGGPGGATGLRDLGSPKRAADVVGALLWEGGLERGFAAEVEGEAEAAAGAAEADATEHERRDLTALDTFTVDPATARDFDDAVSAQREDGGWRLWIHIADVAAHVRPGSALEAEAYARATSVYVPGTVEPMLPAALSGDACSLAPGVERLAVTMEVSLSPEGAARDPRFYRSRIRSDARLDYDQLDRVFSDRERPPAIAADPLAHARAAAAALAGRRSGDSLEIWSPEPDFGFDDAGDVTSAAAREQTESHRLIEQLMILTNEQVARLLEARRAPTLYRIHEPPDPERVALLFDQLAALDVPTPPLPRNLQPQEAGTVVAEASRLAAKEAGRRGHGRAAYTSLILRSLKQAVYSHRNVGHAGLGSPAYAHFTSPIRRYPDLIAHRALLAEVGLGEALPERTSVEEAGWHSSEREREAMRLERRADRICAAFLLERELFTRGWDARFEGEVSGLVGGGAFVSFSGELADVYEGFLPARLLEGDYYDLNETETALVGRRHGHVVRLGDPVSVAVTGIERPRGRVDLEPAVEPVRRQRSSRKRPPAKRPRETRRKAQGTREGGGRRRRRR
jgi:ribonuclease R